MDIIDYINNIDISFDNLIFFMLTLFMCLVFSSTNAILSYVNELNITQLILMNMLIMSFALLILLFTKIKEPFFRYASAIALVLAFYGGELLFAIFILLISAILAPRLFIELKNVIIEKSVIRKIRKPKGKRK